MSLVIAIIINLNTQISYKVELPQTFQIVNHSKKHNEVIRSGAAL